MRILNFGSLNLDHIYSLDHFVEPGETIQAKDYVVNAGGKGLNQSIALARAGAKVFHAGCVGAEGEQLKTLLKENGVDTQFVRTVSEATGHAIIQVDKSGQNCIIIYGGSNRKITDEHIDQALSDFDKGDILLLQNEINGLERIISAAYNRGMSIAFNPSPFCKELLELPLEKVTWFLVNEIEGRGITGETEPDIITDRILELYPNSRVVLTLGPQGVKYGEGNVRLSHPAHEAKVVDTTAAGDTFTGYFLYCISSGMSTEKALETASAASAIAVSREGAAQSIPYARQVIGNLK